MREDPDDMHRLPALSATSPAAPDGAADEPARQAPSRGGLGTRLGLPRLQVATKLYGGIALTLVVVYVLAAATTQFAAQTADSVNRFRSEHFGMIAEAARLEVLLDQQRRAVLSAAAAGERTAVEAGERSLQELGRDISAALTGMGYGATHAMTERAVEATKLAATTLSLARSQNREQTAAATIRYAATLDELKRDIGVERQRRVKESEAALDGLSQRANSLISWVCAAAAATGLLIGPLGLYFLYRVMARLQGIGSALVRLARNDTSVEIPSLADLDEVGQLARSVAVFKAKSIELLQKKGESERLNVQLDAAINSMPLGLSMFDAHERFAGVQHALRPDVRPAGRVDASWHGALRNMGLQGQKRCAAVASRPAAPRPGDRLQPAGLDAHPVRRRSHHFGLPPTAERRRLGGTARGHHAAAPAGGGDLPPRPP
jgi:hypothetical protein